MSSATSIPTHHISFALGRPCLTKVGLMYMLKGGRWIQFQLGNLALLKGKLLYSQMSGGRGTEEGTILQSD